MLSKIAKISKAKGNVPKGGNRKSKSKKASVQSNTHIRKELVRVVDPTLELPDVVYKFSIEKMTEISKSFHVEAVGGNYKPPITAIAEFSKVQVCMTPKQMFETIGTTPEALGPVKTAKYLTMLREYEEQSIIEPIKDLDVGVDVSTEHLTKQPFDEKELFALFFLFDEQRYQYIKIKIARSTIKNAGMGIYTLENIPNGAIGQYKGVARTSEETNMYYAWVIKSFDPQDGIPDDNETYMYYVDATELEHSNWTRYVNCGMKDADNNMEQEQVYDKIFYTTIKDVKAGEELFIDYGEEYRVYNFGMEEGSY